MKVAAVIVLLVAESLTHVGTPFLGKMRPIARPANGLNRDFGTEEDIARILEFMESVSQIPSRKQQPLLVPAQKPALKVTPEMKRQLDELRQFLEHLD